MGEKRREKEKVLNFLAFSFPRYLTFYLLPRTSRVTRHYFAVTVVRDNLSFSLRFPRFLSLVLLNAKVAGCNRRDERKDKMEFTDKKSVFCPANRFCILARSLANVCNAAIRPLSP